MRADHYNRHTGFFSFEQKQIWIHVSCEERLDGKLYKKLLAIFIFWHQTKIWGRQVGFHIYKEYQVLRTTM